MSATHQAIRNLHDLSDRSGVTMTLSSPHSSVTIEPRSPGTAATEEPDIRLLIPADSLFGDEDFLEDRKLELLGDQLRERRNMAMLPTVVYRWKRKGGKNQGVPKAGFCQKLSGPTKHFACADYLVWLAADNLRDARCGTKKLEALLCHELLHIAVDYDEEGEPILAIRHHDAELFAEDLEWYGLYSPDLEKAAEAFEQLRLGNS